MTASTPRTDHPSLLCPTSAAAASGSFKGTPSSSTCAVDHASAHLNDLVLGQQPPVFPAPFGSDNNDMEIDIPDALTLPVLAPRATKPRRREPSATLMDFVSHMSIDDVRSAAAHSFSRSRASFNEYSNTCFLDIDRPSTQSTQSSNTAISNAMDTSSSFDDMPQEAVDEVDVLRPLNAVMPSNASSTTTPWALTTPETMKPTISTPQALRLGGSQKRKSPLLQLHCTPVDGNRPLMIPTLNNSTVRQATTVSQQSSQVERNAKKAKNYQNLLHSAPMLPTSPDLEDRQRAIVAAARRGPAPCFSPPVGGVTLVNPNFRRHVQPATPLATPQQTPRRVVPLATAGIPSLDEEVERSTAPKWLRMRSHQRRNSLLRALRLGATES